MSSHELDRSFELLIADIREQLSRSPLISMEKQFSFVMYILDAMAEEAAKQSDITQSSMQVQFHLFLSFHLIANNQEEKIEETLARLKQWTNRPAPGALLPN